MNLRDKINAELESMSKNVKITADNYKLDCKIAQQQKRIKDLVDEIGTLALIRLDDGAEMFPEIMERYRAIEDARITIAELKCEKKSTKAVCPECGMKTSLDMNYCGKCGAKLPVVETESTNAEGDGSEKIVGPSAEKTDCTETESANVAIDYSAESNCSGAEKTGSSETESVKNVGEEVCCECTECLDCVENETFEKACAEEISCAEGEKTCAVDSEITA